MSIWLSGLVFLLCCTTLNAKAPAHCPLEKSGHCKKGVGSSILRGFARLDGLLLVSAGSFRQGSKGRNKRTRRHSGYCRGNRSRKADICFLHCQDRADSLSRRRQTTRQVIHPQPSIQDLECLKNESCCCVVRNRDTKPKGFDFEVTENEKKDTFIDLDRLCSRHCRSGVRLHQGHL
jgi:hypothetical protein